MAVTSRDLSPNGVEPGGPKDPKGPKRDWSLILIKAGGWLAVFAFGGLFWLVNGGFSVRGLEVAARALGTGGALFWDAVSALRFTPPGLRGTQPLVPWAGVLAASLMQIGIIMRVSRGKGVPPWVVAVGALLSAYDLVTTFFGFGTLQWVQRGGIALQAPLSLLFTFGLEALIGFLLRKRG